MKTEIIVSFKKQNLRSRIFQLLLTPFIVIGAYLAYRLTKDFTNKTVVVYDIALIVFTIFFIFYRLSKRLKYYIFEISVIEETLTIKTYVYNQIKIFTFDIKSVEVNAYNSMVKSISKYLSIKSDGIRILQYNGIYKWNNEVVITTAKIINQIKKDIKNAGPVLK